MAASIEELKAYRNNGISQPAKKRGERKWRNESISNRSNAAKAAKISSRRQ